MSGRDWVVCQLGAREHYILPRELHRQGKLRALFTDMWAPPASVAARLPGALGQRLGDRYAADLAGADVHAFNASAVRFEIGAKLRGEAPRGWDAILRRNAWFEANVARAMRAGRVLETKPIVFAYSYAALGILRAARDAGCTTVLGQIDPAIAEEDIVANAVAAHPALRPAWQRAPAAYWDRWREEAALADHIVVNSGWSQQGLMEAGINAAKLRVVPLAYGAAANQADRQWPERFDATRPLRVLFLGSLNIRKGMAELLAAADLVRDAPIEFHFVGPAEIELPPEALANPKLHFHGPAARGDVARHYAAADLFILPTLSDGFGLTQLEAQAHGLPVIASRRCGDVVRDGVAGVLLDEVTPEAISGALTGLIAAPANLGAMSAAASANVARFSAQSAVVQLRQACE